MSFDSLTPMQKRIFTLLCNESIRQGGGPSISYPQEEIIADAECTMETLRTAIRRLESFGLLTKERKMHGTPRRNGYIYTLRLEP